MKNTGKKILFMMGIALSLTYSTSLKAQYTAQDVTGKVWRSNNGYSEVAGSPFLFDTWSKGIVKFAKNTQIVNGIELKYDQIEDALLYKNTKGETMEVDEAVDEFKIEVPKMGGMEQRLFKGGFKPVGNNTEKTFYEILSDGYVKFVKKDQKTIIEESEYNSASVTRKIVTKTNYYIVKNNQPILVSKNEKAILNAIGDKTTELTAFIKQNKLNLKNDTDILQVLEYYFNISKT